MSINFATCFTGAASTSSTSTSGCITPLPTASSPSNCNYIVGTPNLDGKIHRNPPVCGADYPGSRCADEQCCSSYGICGPITNSQGQYVLRVHGVLTIVSQEEAYEHFCNATQADYRRTNCDGNIEDKTASSSTIMNLFQLRLIIVTAFLFGIFAKF